MKRLALPVLLIAAPAFAEPLQLSLPVDCAPESGCYIQYYVDRDPGPGVADFRCGDFSYDGHKGTDFAVPTLRQLQAGVDVIAAAPGVVAGRRDGMPDTGFSDDTAAGIEKRECGNGVLIRHTNGFETQYCHMARGSIQVAKGETVARGQVLGRVGFSGKTQFPHLHLSVRRDGEVVDPFDPEGTSACNAPAADLWAETPVYRPGGLLDAGASDHVPDYGAIRAGTAASSTLPQSAPALVIFGFAYGGRTGDRMTIEIEGPKGPFHHQDFILEKDQVQFFRAAGRRAPPEGLAPGQYVATVSFERRGVGLGTKQVVVAVE